MVQRRATRLIPCIKVIHGLKMLNLFKRSKKTYLLSLRLLNSLKGLTKWTIADSSGWVWLAEQESINWKRQKINSAPILGSMFSHRVVTVWNSLPGHAVEAERLHFGNKCCGLMKLKSNSLATISKAMFGEKRSSISWEEHLANC